MTSPQDGTIFDTGQVTVEWELPSAEDYGGQYYEVSSNDGEWENVENSTEYTFDGLDEGEHTVRVRAVDDRGTIASDRVTFLVDTQSPEIWIRSPEDDELVTTSYLTVEWESEDEVSGIEGYQIRINGGEWRAPDEDSEHTLWGLPDGEHTVEIRAYDRAGNTETKTVTFEVERDEGLPYFIWFIIALSVTATALFLIRVGLVMAKREEKEQELTVDKTLPELEEEHERVRYDESEQEYKL
ncbi:MAG: hypothetical protein V5A88_06985 [Candidatus Thermoplasmatota archaeon]